MTVRSAPSLPTPSRIVIFFDFIRPDRLFTMPSTILCLRACTTAKFTANVASGSFDSMPNSAALLT